MRRLVTLLLFLGVASARADSLPGSSYIPSDAAVVVQARLADLWKSDSLKDFRRVVARAGPKALETLDKRFHPAPSTAESIVGYALAPSRGEKTPAAVVFFNFAKEFDPKEVLTHSLPKTKPMKGKKSEWHGDEENDYGIMFVGNKTFAFGTIAGISNLADMGEQNKIAGTFPELSDSKRLVVLAGNLSAVPPELVTQLARQLPPPLPPLLLAKSFVLSIDGEATSHVHARVVYPDAAGADDAEKSLKMGIELGKGFIGQAREELNRKLEGDGKAANIQQLPESIASLVGLGALQEAEELLGNLPIKRTGESFALSIPIPAELKPLVMASSLSVGLLLPAVQKVRESANRMKSSNNLKQIAIAFHNAHDVYGYMAAAICDAKNKPLLSWRVHILPYIEQDNLYKQFKLDEPWDSENNKKLIEKMPSVYQIPSDPKPTAGMTYYRTFVGKNTVFGNYSIRARIPASMPDGTSNTWMVVEAGESCVWTKPDDIEYDPKKPPKLGAFHSGGFNVAFWDGSVRYYKKVPKGVHKYINPADGEIIGADEE